MKSGLTTTSEVRRLIDSDQDKIARALRRAIDEETTNYEAFEKAVSIAHREPIKPKKGIKKRVMVKLGNESKEFYDSIADCARFFKVSDDTIRRYAKDGKKFKGVFTIKIVE